MAGGLSGGQCIQLFNVIWVVSHKISPTLLTYSNLLFGIVRSKILRGWTITSQFTMVAKALRTAAG